MYQSKNIGDLLEKSVKLLDETIYSPTLKNTSFTSLQTKNEANKYLTSSNVSFSLPETSVDNESTKLLSIKFSSTNKSELLSSRVRPVNHVQTFANEEVLSNEFYDYISDVIKHSGPAGIFEAFMFSTQSNFSDDCILKRLQEYEKLCQENSLIVLDVLKKISPEDEHFKCILKIYECLTNEKKSWSLISSLYRDRLEPVISNEENFLNNIKFTDQQLADNLFEKEACVRQCQIVIDWLEKMEADAFNQQSGNHLEYFIGTGFSWENTLHSHHKFNSDKQLITELDPDAPIRENKKLHDLDQNDEDLLLKYLLIYLRCGQLDDAYNLCIHVGHPWRAAVLEGWRLYHDPNYYANDLNHVEAVQGNPYRDVWKKCCWQLLQQDQLSTTERGLYGILCGCLTAALEICKSWEDALWAYLRCMVDSYVEQKIREENINFRCLEPLPYNYDAKNLELESIFQQLHVSNNERIKEESINKYHIIQKFVILDDWEAMMEEFKNWMHSPSKLHPQFVRFLVHLIILYWHLGRSIHEDIETDILELYLFILSQMELIYPIAWYTALLPNDIQTSYFARFLMTISDIEKQNLCLKQGWDCNLNVLSATRNVVEYIWDYSDGLLNDENTHLNSDITSLDIKKIEALNWLLFYKEQRSDLLLYSNCLMRKFLAVHKLDAMHQVYKKIPSDIVTYISQQQSKIPISTQNQIHEYLCHEMWIKAQDSLNDWMKYFYNKPQPPSVVQKDSFIEKITSDHQERQFQELLFQWDRTLNHYTNRTCQLLENILLFPNGGWLVDEHIEENDEDRQSQLKILRKLCLPQIFFSLEHLYTLYKCENGIPHLLDLLMDEEVKLYSVFDEIQLKQAYLNFYEFILKNLEENNNIF